MDKKLLFVFNPRAGKGKIRPKLVDIIDEFTKGGYWVTAYTTQCTEDAKELVTQYAKYYDMVVCSGGDGTLNEVVNGMLESEVNIPIGYIPAGTTNDYGKSLGIPRNMLKAAKVVVNGTDFQSDLGRMNGKSFVYVAAFGAFTEVSYQTSQQAKNFLGHSAYVLEGMKSLASIKSYPMKIKMDDIELEDSFLFGMVSNTVSVGGFRSLAGKDILLDDGLFEAVFVRKPSNPIEFQGMLADLVIGSFDAKCIYKYKVSHIEIEADTEVPWTLDGEYGGDHSKVVIENLKRAFAIRIDEERMKLSSEQFDLDEDEEDAEEDEEE